MPYWIAAIMLVTLSATRAAAEPAERAKMPAPERADVVAKITPSGVWLAAGRDARCFVPRKDKALDRAALEVELRRLRGEERSTIAIGAIRGVTYQELIVVMDLAIKVALVDARLSAIDDLGAVFPDTARGRASAPAHCPSPPKLSPKLPSKPPAARAPEEKPAQLTRPLSDAELARRREILERPLAMPPTTKPDYSKVPVVIVTKMDVTLQGTPICPVKGLIDGKGVIQPLVKALEGIAAGEMAASHPAGGNRQLILQADGSTDAVVIERIWISARAGGYDDLLFAVKSVSPSP